MSAHVNTPHVVSLNGADQECFNCEVIDPNQEPLRWRFIPCPHKAECAEVGECQGIPF